MPKIITINNITGSTPFNISLCDNPVTVCVYVATISTLPYSFEIPTILQSQDDFNLKVEDNNGCINYSTLTIS
jgi:hypothetical protein